MKKKLQRKETFNKIFLLIVNIMSYMLYKCRALVANIERNDCCESKLKTKWHFHVPKSKYENA